MNYYSLRNLAIGLAVVSATMSTPQAADIGMPLLTERPSELTSAKPDIPSQPRNLVEKSNLKGAQGPIRTDFSNSTAKADAEALRLDLQAGRYPMNETVAIP